MKVNDDFSGDGAMLNKTHTGAPLMPGNVVTLTSQDIQRKRLQREGRSVFVEFFCAPGCDIADACVEDWPEDLAFADMAMWLRSFAHELDELAKQAENPEELCEQNTYPDEPE